MPCCAQIRTTKLYISSEQQNTGKKYEKKNDDDNNLSSQEFAPHQIQSTLKKLNTGFRDNSFPPFLIRRSQT